jgi:hypothetical protein
MGMVFCRGCAKEIHETAPVCPACGAPQFAVRQAFFLPVAGQPMDSEATLIRQIAEYEMISGYIWIALGCVQILSVVAVIAGIWNIFAGRSRIQMSKNIKTRDLSVPMEFEGVSGLVVIGVLNVLLGGLIGIIFVGFDFYIRDKVISNSHLFVNDPSAVAPPAIAEGVTSAT